MRRRLGVEHLFLVIGLGLLAGALFWYDYSVRRPLTWPRADAKILASRVVNSEGPSTFTPELILRYRAGGQLRERTLVANWSSGSYDAVRQYVDGYPAGGELSVAVNPADPDDVRYELGWTLMNLLGPLALGTMGVVFAGVYVAVSGIWRRRSPVRHDAPALEAHLRAIRTTADGSHRVARRLGLAFVAIGVIVGALAAMAFVSEGDVAEWPEVSATVVDSRVVNARSTSTSRSGTASRLYDAQVTFRYEVNGQSYQSGSRTGVSTSSRSAAEDLVATYAPGTTHSISYRPDDPNIIRFEAGWRSRGIWLPLGLGFMAIVFLFFGVLSWRMFGRAAPAAIDVDRNVEEAARQADRFRPRV